MATPPIPPKPPAVLLKPATPFIAALPTPKQPPSWPAQPSEPRAQPPQDARITERLAAALAATPVRPGDRPAAIVRAGRTGLRAAVFAPPPRRPIGPLPIVLTTASLVIFLGAALLAFPATKQDQAVAADTDAPAATFPAVALGSEPPATAGPSVGPGATEQGPTATEPLTPGGGPGPTAPPGPRSTPRPTRPPATPKPTAPGGTPTPAPTPTPSPTLPGSTPTPDPICTVPNLINQNSSNVGGLWTAAGFDAANVTYNPTIPPQYKVAWQSLAAGTDVLCTSIIEVRKTAP
jgi:hypothetical protein